MGLLNTSCIFSQRSPVSIKKQEASVCVMHGCSLPAVSFFFSKYKCQRGHIKCFWGKFNWKKTPNKTTTTWYIHVSLVKIPVCDNLV